MEKVTNYIKTKGAKITWRTPESIEFEIYGYSARISNERGKVRVGMMSGLRSFEKKDIADFAKFAEIVAKSLEVT